MYTLNKNEDRIERGRCGPSGEHSFKWDKQVDRLDSKVPESRRIGAIKKTFIFSGCKEDLLCKKSKFKHFYWLLL